jgi:hypothetical protein
MFESLMTFTDEERVELAADFKSLLQNRGFRKFLALLERRALHVGNAALNDDTRPKDFWIGFREGATGIGEEVKGIIEAGDELKLEIQRDKKVAMGIGGSAPEPNWED